MIPRRTSQSLILAGCLFAAPAFLPAQAAPAQDPTAQLRAAVERLRTADLSPEERARIKETLKLLQDTLQAGQQRSKTSVFQGFDGARASREADALRTYERAAERASAEQERATRDLAQAKKAYAAAIQAERDQDQERAKVKVKEKLDRDRDQELIQRLQALHAAEADAAEGRARAAEEKVHQLWSSGGGWKVGQAPRATAGQNTTPQVWERTTVTQDAQIRELIAQVRRQLQDVRRTMDEIRRRLDGEGRRGRGAGASTAQPGMPGMSGAPPASRRGQAAFPAAPEGGGMSGGTATPVAPPARARGRGVDVFSTTPDAPLPPRTRVEAAPEAIPAPPEPPQPPLPARNHRTVVTAPPAVETYEVKPAPGGPVDTNVEPVPPAPVPMPSPATPVAPVLTPVRAAGGS